MFVLTIPESSPAELSKSYSDVPLPASNVELLPSAMSVWTSPGKDLNFWIRNLAHLTRISLSRQNQLWDPNKYTFPEIASIEALIGADRALLKAPSVASHPVKVVVIVNFGPSSLL